jgi:hypothetical protein
MPAIATARLFLAVAVAGWCRIAKKEFRSKALFALFSNDLLCNIQKTVIRSAAFWCGAWQITSVDDHTK